METKRRRADLIQVLAKPVNTVVCSAIKNNGVLIRATIATGINRVLKALTKRIARVRCSSSSPSSSKHVLSSVESKSRFSSIKFQRTIQGGIVTTIIIIGLLLIIVSVVLALAFVYIRRKNLRRRQFTYSLESTSDDWEPSGTGYHLFDNWTGNGERRRTTNTNQIDNVIIDANENMPIATNRNNR